MEPNPARTVGARTRGDTDEQAWPQASRPQGQCREPRQPPERL